MIPLPAIIQESAPDHFRVSYEIPEVSDTELPAPVHETSQPDTIGQLKLFN